MNRLEFYQMVVIGIRRYLPLGYQKYSVHIKEVTISERLYSLLILEKEEIQNMPVMSMEPYLDRVKEGEDEQSVLIDLAVDYVKMVSLFYQGQHLQKDQK